MSGAALLCWSFEVFRPGNSRRCDILENEGRRQRWDLSLILWDGEGFFATNLFLQRWRRSRHPVVRAPARGSEPHPAALEESSHDEGDGEEEEEEEGEMKCVFVESHWRVRRLSSCRVNRSVTGRGQTRVGVECECDNGRGSGFDGRGQMMLTCGHMQDGNRIQASDGI